MQCTVKMLHDDIGGSNSNERVFQTAQVACWCTASAVRKYGDTLPNQERRWVPPLLAALQPRFRRQASSSAGTVRARGQLLSQSNENMTPPRGSRIGRLLPSLIGQAAATQRGVDMQQLRVNAGPAERVESGAWREGATILVACLAPSSTFAWHLFTDYFCVQISSPACPSPTPTCLLPLEPLYELTRV